MNYRTATFCQFCCNAGYVRYSVGIKGGMKQRSNGLKLTTLGLLFVVTSGVLRSEAILSFQRGSESNINIVLKNDEPVAAMQFTLHGSSLTLETVQISGRSLGSSWTASYHLINDSTMNVLLIRTGSDLEAGNGIIATVTVQSSGNPGRISFSRVIISSPSATAIASTSIDLEWESSRPGAPFSLGQNYPNPFNPSTTVPYRLDEPGQVQLSIYDIAGREVNRIVDRHVAAGSYSIAWPGIDAQGNMVPSGVYFVKLRVGSKEMVKKMVLTR